MKKNQKNSRLKVLFDASVVLSGLHSPNGASGWLLKLVGGKKVLGIISETILKEIIEHSDKLNLDEDESLTFCNENFLIFHPPDAELTVKYKRIVIDEGDAHVLASAKESGVDFLVTLDKKHLLILKDKVKNLKIVTPGELILFVPHRN